MNEAAGYTARDVPPIINKSALSIALMVFLTTSSTATSWNVLARSSFLT